MTTKISSYYDSFSSRQIKAGINVRHRSIMKYLIDHGLKKYQNVLEIGCGIGTLTELLVKNLKQGYLTSIDISPQSIEIAKSRLSKYKNLNLIAEDITEWETNKNFDVVVLPDVLEHIPLEKHGEIFKKLNSLLKHNGFIGINIPNPFFQDYFKAKGIEMQIIDLSLHLPLIVQNINKAGLYIDFMQMNSVWHKPADYQFFVLRKESLQKNFVPIKFKKSFFKRVFEKINYEIRKMKKNES